MNVENLPDIPFEQITVYTDLWNTDMVSVDDTDDGGVNGWAIFGIVAGTLVVIVIIVLVVWYFMR